jgi:D-glycero-alpha-D-manno-heptose-7-phosphate kinase
VIISKTPYRISFFGGGTDYPQWYTKHGGAVLGTSIDKYCYITLRELPPFFSHRARIVYSKVELVDDIDEIQHPVVRAILRYLEGPDRIEIHHDGDLPARTGIGSSSSFTVGLLHALQALKGRMFSKQELAWKAIFVEQILLKENVGSQDQTLSTFGGFNRVEFRTDGEIDVTPVVLPADRIAELESHLMLFFTGFSRNASEIAGAQIQTLDQRERQLKSMRGMVESALDILADSHDIRRFGSLLHDAWEIKRSLTDLITSDSIDQIYVRARAAGAIGGKLLGAGGGGFMLLFVEPAKQALVKDALRELVHVPFKFERHGSQIIYYHP